MKCQLCKMEQVTNGVAVCDLCEAQIDEVVEYFSNADECSLPYVTGGV